MIRFEGEDRRTVEKAAALKRNARKADTKARPKSEKATRGREIDNGFLAYIRRQPCAARHMGHCDGPVQAAHIRYHVHGISNSAGMGVKNHDRHCNPLCNHHHNSDQHKRKEQSFWASIGKDAYETAAGHYAEYLAQGESRSLRQSKSKMRGE